LVDQPRKGRRWFFWSVPADYVTTVEKSASRVVDGNLSTPARWSTLTAPGWSGPAVVLDDATVVWGYTAELLAFMCRNLSSPP
jgi:hypothetical protein